MMRWLAAVTVVLGLATATARADGSADGSAAAPAAAAQPDDYPHIYLVTMGIGSLIWERHGHIALCVEYAPGQEPECYNYGIGDFHDPLNMVWGFFRGTHSFWAGKDLWRNMMAVYYQFDRTIWKQLLPLTPAQKQKVLVKLESDILEENRYYAYDHFADNCTTRIRNIIDDATDGALRNMPDQSDGRTFRDYARDGFAGMRIPLLGTDIAMGRTTDRAPSFWERMFLPQYLREAVQQRWGIKPVPVYVRKECRAEYKLAAEQHRAPDDSCVERGVPTVEDPPSGRVIVALVLLLLTAPAWLTRLWGRLQRTGLAFAVIPYWLLGSIFTFLAIISPLPYVTWNETCLVWLPLDIIVVFAGERLQLRYAKARLAMIALMIVAMIVGLLKQPLWPELVWPLVPMLSIVLLPRTRRSGS